MTVIASVQVVHRQVVGRAARRDRRSGRRLRLAGRDDLERVAVDDRRPGLRVELARARGARRARRTTRPRRPRGAGSSTGGRPGRRRTSSAVQSAFGADVGVGRRAVDGEVPCCPCSVREPGEVGDDELVADGKRRDECRRPLEDGAARRRRRPRAGRCDSPSNLKLPFWMRHVDVGGLDARLVVDVQQDDPVAVPIRRESTSQRRAGRADDDGRVGDVARAGVASRRRARPAGWSARASWSAHFSSLSIAATSELRQQPVGAAEPHEVGRVSSSRRRHTAWASPSIARCTSRSVESGSSPRHVERARRARRLVRELVADQRRRTASRSRRSRPCRASVARRARSWIAFGPTVGQPRAGRVLERLDLVGDARGGRRGRLGRLGPRDEVVETAAR